MKFDYDIFISFAQSKNSVVDIEWSLKFCNILDDLLSKMTNERPVIITSADVDARVNMFNVTKNDIYSKSAVFLVIMSPDSLEDKEFLEEINSFSEFLEYKAEGNIKKSNRIIKIMGSPILFRDLPNVLKFENSYNFYEKNLMSGRTSLFDLTYESNKDNIFWSRLVDLAYDVANTVNKLKNDKDIFDLKDYIYLAPTTPDQEISRDNIKRDLKQQGFHVVPEFELPEDPNLFQKYVLELIEKTKMSIHVIGGHYGSCLLDYPYSAIEYQNKIVAEYIQNKPKEKQFTRIIWTSNDLKILEQKQRLYIGRLRRNEPLEDSEEIECPIEELKSIINAKLDNNSYKKEKTGDNSIFFQYPDNDNDLVKTLNKQLLNKGWDIVTTESIEQENILDIYWEKLKEVDVLMLFPGDNLFWCDFKIKDAIKAKVYRDESHPLIIIVVSEDIDKHGQPTMDNYHVISPDSVITKLNEFLS